MQPPTSDNHAEHVTSSRDLPYGPLPVRVELTPGQSETPTLEELFDLSCGDAADEDRALDESTDDGPDGGDDTPALSAAVSVSRPRPETDDDVHFGVAARALGVSRKTVERMVKRGELERGPSNAPATVSKRALVATLEAHRRDVGHLTRATEIKPSKSTNEYPAASPQRATSAVAELVPILAPLLDEFVAARTRAAALENELERLRARAGRDRARDELLLALATTGWWGRRKTRRAVLRQYLLGDFPDSDSAAR